MLTMFIARVSLAAPKPVRVYLHHAGFRDAFGPLYGVYSGLDAAEDYLSAVLRKNHQGLKASDYILAFLWGNKGRKVAELFGFADIREWPGNPDVYSWVFKDGVCRPEERQISCGDSVIVLGREEEHRRKTKNLQEYMQNPPELGRLEPAFDWEHRKLRRR